jgi:DNA-binding LytR/AlgR family response regulator
MSSALPLFVNAHSLDESLRLSKYNDKVIKRTRQKRYDFDVELVTYCVGFGNYTYIHFANNKRLLISYTLSVLMRQFDNVNFFRAHKSNVVNLNHIAQIAADRCEITMLDGAILKLSRRKIQEIALLVA